MAAVTNLLWLNPDSIPENIAPGDTVTAPGDWTFLGNVDIAGNLTVAGSITSGSTLNSVSNDAFIDLGFGYLLNTANQPGGFTLDTRLAAGFTPGQVTDFPTLTTFTYTDAGGSTLLAADDIVMITNLPAGLVVNEGYYIVQSVSGAAFPQTVTIYNLPQTSTPWANTAFTLSGVVVPPGNAAKINMAVVAVADGTSSFKDINGTPYPVGKVVSAYITDATLPLFQANGAYEAIGATTLQEAYDNGNTIVTAGARDIAFTLTSGNFTVDGAGLINQTVTGDITSSSAGTNRLDSTGFTGVSIEANSGPINIGTETFTGGSSPAGSQTVQIPAAGNNTFTQPNGFLESPNWPAVYPASANGYTVFSGIPGVYRTISGLINTEFGLDFIRVYDGIGIGGTLLYQASGNPGVFSFTSSGNQTFTVRFSSDSTLQFAGFNLTVTGFYVTDLQIGTGAGARAIALGALTSNLTTNANVLDINATSNVTVDSTGGTIGIGTDASTGAINIAGPAATGARTVNVGTGGIGSKTVVIGEQTLGASSVTIFGGAVTGVVIASSSVNTPVTIGNGTGTQTLRFGTGSGVKTTFIGSTNTTSGTTVSGGTNGATLSTSTTAGPINITNTGTGIINIANDTGTGVVNIVGSSATTARTVNIATGGTASKVLTLGSTALASSATLQSGTGNVVLTTQTTGQIQIGNDVATGNIFIASSTGTRSVLIGTGTSTQTLSFGTGSGAKTVGVGSTNTTSSTAVSAGSGGISLTTAATTGNITATNTSTGILNLFNDAGTGAVNLVGGAATGARSINIGTGVPGIKTITMGSTVTGSYLYEQSPHIFGSASTMVPGGVRVFNNSGGVLAPGTIIVTQSGTSAVGGRPFVVAAAAGTANIKGFTGVTIESLGIATEGNAASVSGTVCFMTISPAPAATDANLPVYLSTTAGQGTMTAPSASGTRVYLLGFLTGTTADANGNYPVQLYPQYIADIP